MARTKKQVKVKEPVRLRFNELKDGRKSIYLDIYYNGRRTYQSLKLYLVPETDVSAQIQNANTLAIANAIKTEKILDLTNKIAGITDRSYKANMLFTDWMRVYRQDVEKRASASALIWVDRVTNELEKYDNSVTLAEIDRDYIMRFLSHLLDRPALTRDHNQLAKNTVFLYLSYIRAALNYAVKENLLQSSPFKKIKRDMLSGSEAKREYLTVEEVKRLIATPCRRDDMKAAFLFSCSWAASSAAAASCMRDTDNFAACRGPCMPNPPVTHTGPPAEGRGRPLQHDTTNPACARQQAHAGSVFYEVISTSGPFRKT